MPESPSARWISTVLACLFLALVAAAAGGGCRRAGEVLYALPLSHEPTEADWAGAVPLRLEAAGGRTSRPGDRDVDSDAVHKATASCHHGSQAPAVGVEIRAFYTAERFFVRFEWVDPTEDLGPSWSWDGAQWVSGGLGEDGLGILWGTDAETFSCVRTCHLVDWRVAGPRAFADYRMASPEGADPLDFWVWRAGRARPGGLAEDGRLGTEGRRGDLPGELFEPNSVRARSGATDVFGVGDRPWEAPAPEPGAFAAAYRVVAPAEDRLEVEARGERLRGRWRLTVSRSLRGSAADDVVLEAGRQYAFGLALLDGVEKDHTAVPEPIRLLLVAGETLARAEREEK